MLGYFRLAVNARDNEALLRIVGFPGRGIGETTMKKVSANAIEHHCPYLAVMRSPDETALDVSAATKKRLQAFALMMDGLATLSEETDAYHFAEQVLRVTGVQTAMALDRTPEGIDRAQNVQELLNAIREFVDQRQQEGIDYTPITDFLSEVSLQTDQDENLADTTERVTLMTVHSAKGLEFPVVFIAGMEENLFPSQFCVKPSEIEEERRLLYVAITRSMEQCYLSFARQRFRNGQENRPGAAVHGNVLSGSADRIRRSHDARARSGASGDHGLRQLYQGGPGQRCGRPGRCHVPRVGQAGC